jgi:hypothetical protein
MAVETVLIACKAPGGLVLDLDRYEVAGPNVPVRVIKSELPPVTLKGWAHAWGKPDTTEGGYALTPVPAAFWNAWYERNKGCSLLVDKIILPPHKDAIGLAHDHAEVPVMHPPAKPTDIKGVQAFDKAT